MNITKIDEQIKKVCRGAEVEVCGIVLNDDLIVLNNDSQNPREEFIMDLPDEYDAIFHSHPGGPFYPTKADMISQESTAVPWAIYAEGGSREEVFWFGETAPKDPLLKRVFRYGVTDCYELVRDFYREVHNINLPGYPREWAWWDDDDDMYDRLFKEAGFYEIPLSKVLPGDSLLARIRSKHSNHAAVYLGNDLILHHLSSKHPYDPAKLSQVEPASRWINFFSKALRHENSNITREVGQGIWPPISV